MIDDMEGSADEADTQPDDSGEAIEEPSNEDTSETGAEAVAESSDPAEQDTRPEPDGSLTADENGGRPDAPSLEQLQAQLEEIRKDRAFFQSKHQENVQKLKQYEGVDPQAVRQWREEQQRRQMQELPAHNRYSPKHQQFLQAKQKAQVLTAEARRRGASNEELAQVLQSNLSDEELGALRQAEDYQRQVNEAIYSDPTFYQFATNPVGFLQGFAQQVVMPMMREQFKAEQSVNSWFDQNPELEKRYGAQIVQMLQSGKPWNDVRERIELQARLDALQSRTAEVQQVAKVAKERERLRKRDATLTVDAPAGSMSVEKVMKQKGIRPGSEEHARLLLQLQDD